jgi:dethiobiotin synthetase
MRGVFVTGTGTEIGKTIVAGAVCAALAERGERVAAFKPAVTGLDEPAAEWPHDHELLAGAASAGQSPAEVAPHRYGPPVSPHFAAERAGDPIEPARLVEAACAVGRRADALVCEGTGGLLVPITPGYLVRDLAVDLGLPVVVAAATGLGTINHTLLTVEAARSAGPADAGGGLEPGDGRSIGADRCQRTSADPPRPAGGSREVAADRRLARPSSPWSRTESVKSTTEDADRL